MDTYPYGIRGVKDVQICALSGMKIRPGDMAINIEGTSLFYRVASRHYLSMTAEQQEMIEAAILADAGVTRQVRTETVPKQRGNRKPFDGVDAPEVGDSNGR